MRAVFEPFVPSEFRDIIACLEDWIVEQDVVERARQACLVSLTDYLSRKLDGYERLEGIEPSGVETRLQRHSLMFEHGGLCVPHVMTELSVFVKSPVEGINVVHQNRRMLGTFRYMLRLDGRHVSESLNLFPTETEAGSETL